MAVGTGSSYRDYVSVNPVTVICVEAVTEHLLGGIETIDDRNVVDNFLITKLNEMRDAIADGATAITLGRGQFAEHRGAIAVHQHRLRNEAPS